MEHVKGTPQPCGPAPQPEMRIDRAGATDRTRTPARPLVVDLDGTLLRSDLLVEALFAEIGARPGALPGLVAALSHGKAALKAAASAKVEIDPGRLPYDEAVIERIRTARRAGRPVYIASAAHRRLVGRIADHLGLFDGWFASDDTVNLSGEAKAETLVAAFGEKGFDYIGNDAADLPVWSHAAKAIAVRLPLRSARRLLAFAPDAETIPSRKPGFGAWARLLRTHQYAKNALVFLPLLTSHSFSLAALGAACLAFAAFSLCASGIYVLNDLVDLQDDRAHPRKRERPLANGEISVLRGLLAVPLLIVAAFAVGAFLGPSFLLILGIYVVLTTAYSFALKRMMLIDVITLAGLYTVRVIGGAAAIAAVPSSWLLAFCMSIFLSLALLKRHVELTVRLDAGLPDPANRDYRKGDLGMVASLAAAAGFNAVTVFALYISSDAVHELYSRPQILWLVCPVLIYWIARILMLAQRRKMHDDPVVFALHDRPSLAVAAASAALIVAAV